MSNESDKPVDNGDELNDEQKAAKSPLEDVGKSEDEGKKEPKDKLSAEEGEETAEEKAEREKEEAEAAAKKNIRIPKYRFDEVRKKAQAREAELLKRIEELEGSKMTSEVQKTIKEASTKIEEMQDQYEDLILDGKKDEARKLRKKIDTIREQLSDYKASLKSDEVRSQALDEMSYKASLAGFEAKYPVMNPDHEDYDQEQVDEIAELMTDMIKAGKPRATALGKAVLLILGKPPSTKDEDAAGKAAKELAEQRAVEARKKAAAANGKQPPNAANVGKDHDKAGKGGEGSVDVMKMNQTKFAKLDEETLSKLRGDDV